MELPRFLAIPRIASLLILAAGPVHSAEFSLLDFVQNIEPGVVHIETHHLSGKATGSGFIVHDGWVVTNYHVVEGVSSVDGCRICGTRNRPSQDVNSTRVSKPLKYALGCMLVKERNERSVSYDNCP